MPDIIIQAFQRAFELIFSGNPDVYGNMYRSLYVSGLGTLLACTWSIPIAIALGLYAFRGRWAIKGFFNALIGIPTVALGLILFLLMSKQGELGFLKLLFTLNGIMIGQAILVTPIIVTFTSNALATSDVQLKDLAKTLGASNLKASLTVLRETIWSMVLAITAAFNRGFGELGIATIVGGSLLGETRVLTTAIALELNFGNFSFAMAYTIILMAIVIAITLVISLIERIRQEEGSSWKIWRRKMWRRHSP